MAQNLKMLQEKHDQWVLETVDCLRQRKARPDLQRISRMMERFHGLTANETRESLERLSNDGVVMKVHFKGNISYRHVKRCSGDQSNSNYYNTSIRIAQAIKSIMTETGDSASFGDIETWLISKNPETRLVKHRLQTALNREIESRTVTRLSDKTYVLTDCLPKSKTSAGETSNPKLEEKKSDNKVPKKKEALQPNKAETTTNQSVKSAESQDDKLIKEIDESSLKRSRPLSKRKKFKKTHGPDFETPGKLRKCVTKDEDGNSTPVCGYCSKTADSNNEGKEEPLLTCKDCDAKAHPSCMDYSPDLARRALNSPWQCMDCKTCFLCEGSENADLMLFCDACDKGYHMICHEPPLNNKPKGKWICSICQDEMEAEKKKQGQLEKSNKNNEKKGAVKGNKDNENTDDNQSKKRKLSRQKSLPSAKRVKTSPSSSDDCQSQTSSQNTQNLQESFTDFTKGTCLLTPSASPKPSDTFDYEMKMSQLGFPVSIIEDNTTYSDATHWNTDDVVKFFEGCGFKENAQAFKEQEIDGRSLLLMQRNDVLTGLGLKLGPALKIYHKVVKLQFYSQSSNV